MSDLGKSSASSEASASGKKKQQQQQNPPNLRPLAPKPAPPPPTDQSLAIRTSPLPPSTSAHRRRNPIPCPVCFRVGCQLPTHSAYPRSTSRSSEGSSPDKSSSVSSSRDLVFTSSYAYKLGQQHVDKDTASSRAGPVYDLPLDAEMNTPEMHQLFYQWFNVDFHSSFRIPRPPEMVGDIIWNPFFLPALQDPLLCLSILAASAASRPRSSGQQSRNVESLTLLGQAIQQMRERINSDPTDISDTTITAATFLWLVNIYLEDTAAMASHASSIYAFVETRGGLDQLGLVGAVAGFIRWVDACHSFVIPVACHYLNLPDPGLPAERPLARYGSFWDSKDTWEIVIDSDVASACEMTCRLIELSEQARTNGLVGVEYTRMLQRLFVLYAKGSVLRAGTYQDANVDECFVIALSLIQFHCFCGLENLDFVARTNLARLADAIKATGGPTFWKKDPEPLVWLLFIVVMIPAEVKEKSWCLPFLCRIVITQFGEEGSLTKSWQEELKVCLQSFVWSDFHLEQYFLNACRLIEEELEDDDAMSE